MDIRYPIYILSKGRPNGSTARIFNKYNIPYKIVIEKEDYKDYLTKLKEKLETLNEVNRSLESNLEYNAYGLVYFKIQMLCLKITKIEQEILELKEQMNTPVNKDVARYLDYCRYG